MQSSLRRRGLVIAVLFSLCGCKPDSPVAILNPAPVNGIGYVVFNAPIVPASRDILIADVDKLLDAGAHEIQIGMNSPGGDVEAAQGIVDYMDRQHTQRGVTFKAYNLGLVASAATYVFLNAQNRYTAPQSAFLFHAAGVTATGPITAENLRDQASKLDAYERTMRATLNTRTRLSDEESLTYIHRTVILNPDDATRDGIVDGIAIFAVPSDAASWVIATPHTRPATAQTPP